MFHYYTPFVWEQNIGSMRIKFMFNILPIALGVMLFAGISFASEQSLLSPIPSETPSPKENPTTPQKVKLGKRLFFDERLSGNNEMSCATCHDPDKSFTDGLPKAKGINGKILQRNTPTVLNVGWFDSFFWDGRSETLEEQALVPIQSPVEMNQDMNELVNELANDSEYVKLFSEVFDTEISQQGIANTLAAFQRTLVTQNSPFDQYLAGDENALSNRAKEGMRLFMGSADCVRCHHGPLLSDGKYYRFGIGTTDKGRGELTGEKEDRYKFRTPSLRNVAQTAPYMHDGSEKTLFDAVEFYYRRVPSSGPEGLPLDVEPLLAQSYSEIGPIVEFLESLSGSEPDF